MQPRLLDEPVLTGLDHAQLSRLVRLDLVGTSVPMHCTCGRSCCSGMNGGLA